MNLVRLGMIVSLGAIAAYAMSIYAAIPPATLTESSRMVKETVTYMCPSVNNGASGAGSVFVALVAIGGAITVAAVDLSRRVY